MFGRVRCILGSMAILLCAAVAQVRAHQYWLTSTEYAAKRGTALVIGACSGVGFQGEAKLWSPERCVDFSWITFRRFTLMPMAPDADPKWAWHSYADTAGTWVQYQSNFTCIELPAAEFDAYLAEEGLYAPLAARRRMQAPGAGRERYRRCAKLWLGGHELKRVVRVIGQPLELVPLSAPGASRSLRVRVLWQGVPLPGAIVKTWRQPLTQAGRTRAVGERDSVAMVEQVRADRSGEVTLGVAEAGEWLASVVHMVPCADTTLADWESTWASLTFARRPNPDAKRR